MEESYRSLVGIRPEVRMDIDDRWGTDSIEQTRL